MANINLYDPPIAAIHTGLSPTVIFLLPSSAASKSALQLSTYYTSGPQNTLFPF